MKDMILNKEVTERAVLVGLVTPTQSETKAQEYLDELEFLADTAGAETVKTFTQKLDYPNPRTFVGKGKLEEIREYIEANDIGMAIFDDDLTSKQVSNIESELKVKILDRTSLILDIFAKRAKSSSIMSFGKDIDHTVKVFIGYEITRSMTAEMAYIERLIALRDWRIGGLLDRIGEIYSSTFVKIGCNLLKSSLGNHEIGCGSKEYERYGGPFHYSAKFIDDMMIGKSYKGCHNSMAGITGCRVHAGPPAISTH